MLRSDEYKHEFNPEFKDECIPGTEYDKHVYCNIPNRHSTSVDKYGVLYCRHARCILNKYAEIRRLENRQNALYKEADEIAERLKALNTGS